MEHKNQVRDENLCSKIVQDILLNYSLNEEEALNLFIQEIGQNIKFIGQY